MKGYSLVFAGRELALVLEMRAVACFYFSDSNTSKTLQSVSQS